MHLIAGTNTYESLIHALRDKLEKMSEMVNHLCLRKVIDKMSGVENRLKLLMKEYGFFCNRRYLLLSSLLAPTVN